MDRRNEVPRWDLPSLIGAYVDLCIAYLLLCCSALTFWASSFLSFFSLRLPCPQIHGFLVEAPPHIISGVQMSVLTRFPFWIDGGGLIRREERKEEYGLPGAEDVLMIHGKEEEEEMDARRRRKRGPRGRRRGCEEEKMRSLSLSSSENFNPFLQLGWRSPANSSGRIQSRGHYSPSGDIENSWHNCSTNNFPDGLMNLEDGKVEGVEINNFLGSERSETETIKILEHALEAEQNARSALYRELEKERSCAATAAEEAMAMIERLQMEKATIEMNARQYQRMIEEKEAFDEEEMEILKEIVVRRERELYVLGKEVELLRQMMTSSSSSGDIDAQEVFDGNQFEMGNIKEEKTSYSSLGLEGHSSTMLQQISESNITKDSISYKNETSSMLLVGGERSKSFDCPHTELQQVNADEESLDFQEKGIVSVDIYASNVQIQGSKVNNASSPLVRPVNSTGNDLIQRTLPFMASGENSSTNLEPQVSTLDVHVIDDNPSVIRGENGKQQISRMGSDSVHSHDSDFSSDSPFQVSNTEILSDNSSSSWVPGQKHSIRRFISDSESLLRSLEASPLNPSGNSMSLVDRERVKLEKQVETLRKRLRNVQEGREKLNLSVEQRVKRKENVHLQLLQEITFQLQQIKQQSNPAKTTRHASLPPSSSKSNSRKRQSRSDSVGIDGGK